MSRVFWFAVGAGSGVYALVKTRRAAHRLTPEGVADQLGALGYGARLFHAEVRAGMAEREAELRGRLHAQLGTEQPARRQLAQREQPHRERHRHEPHRPEQHRHELADHGQAHHPYTRHEQRQGGTR